MSSPSLLESNRHSEGVGTGGSLYSSSVGMSLKTPSIGSEGPRLGELVLAALEACRLC